MSKRFIRTEALIGKEKFEKLRKARIIIFGIGGVGSYALEALARSGIEKIDLVDCDKVDITNINRQIIALESTIAKSKVETAKNRILDINPKIKTNAIEKFFCQEDVLKFDFSKYDYIVDCIDSVKTKIALIETANKLNIKIISSMGTGNKLDANKFEVCDIYNTSVCPLARILRTELKKRGVKKLKVVYSKEVPKKIENTDIKIASIAFVPSVAGLIIASEVVKDLIK